MKDTRIVLTEEEQKKAYAKYVYKKAALPTREQLKFIEEKKTMDPSKVLLTSNGNMNNILKDGYLEDEMGVCLLPNGGGYVAMHNKMPGVTLDMYLFWNKWWSSAPDASLRYKIWYPPTHYVAGFRWSCEDVGNGPEDLIFFNRLTTKELGLDEELVKTSGLLLADGGNVISKCYNAPMYSAPQPGVVCHFVREMEDGSGIELRSRFWKGFQLGENGLFDAMGPYTPKETLESLFALADHNAREMANLASILPTLYEEERHTVGM